MYIYTQKRYRLWNMSLVINMSFNFSSITNSINERSNRMRMKAFGIELCAKEGKKFNKNSKEKKTFCCLHYYFMLHIRIVWVFYFILRTTKRTTEWMYKQFFFHLIRYICSNKRTFITEWKRSCFVEGWLLHCLDDVEYFFENF